MDANLHGEVSTVSELGIKILDKLGNSSVTLQSLFVILPLKSPIPVTEKHTYRRKTI